MTRRALCAGALVIAVQVADNARAQGDAAALVLDPVVVTATRRAERSFDVPASVDVIDGTTIRDGQPAINLSESLVRVPGIFAANRNNYAQDLQISSRGFGARATFGVRGVRLYQDFIPATMPDGQGQTGSFSLLSTQRIEVLRGPFSTLYGNASGGVIAVFTEDPTRRGGDLVQRERRQLRHVQPRLQGSRAPPRTSATYWRPTVSTRRVIARTRPRRATSSTPSSRSKRAPPPA